METIDKSYMLTQERVETARETIADAWAYLSHEKAMDRKDIEILETLTAAIEFVEQFRWRDPKVELPPLEKIFIAIDENGEIGLGEMYTRVYWDFDDPLAYPNPRIMFSYSEDRYEANRDLGARQAWMPLSEWERRK